MPHWQPANDDLPASGVAAGTYGDGTHVGQVTVDAAGRVTGAADVPITGGGGGAGLVLLYEHVLAGTAASIDTGVGGIAAGHDDLLVTLNLRSDAAVGGVDCRLNFNGDTGANYDVAWVRNSAGTLSAIDAHGIAFTAPGQVSDATFAAGVFSAVSVTIPKYATTATFKNLVSLSGPTDTTTSNDRIIFASGLWRSTAAISRIAIFPGAGSFVAGSSMTVYGTQ